MIRLEPRAEVSKALLYVTPVIAVAITILAGVVMFAVLGKDPIRAISLIFLQPTWGVDAAAAADLHRALQELAQGGAAILVISQDLSELMAISVNFAVISEGRLSQPRPTGEMSIEEIGLLMGGVHSSASPGASPGAGPGAGQEAAAP